MKNKNLLLALRLIPAIILFQTLYFKFTAHPDSVFIFSQIGAEPIGRISLGILELITAILIIYRPTAFIGSVMAVGLMSGAIFMHLTKLGIVVQNDGGILFMLALAVMIISVINLFIYSHQGRVFFRKIILSKKLT